MRRAARETIAWSVKIVLVLTASATIWAAAGSTPASAAQPLATQPATTHAATTLPATTPPQTALPSARAGARPNIIFIFADDHAAQAMSCYGSRINKTPNLDRIAAGGMLFRNCFCTNSICGPSRAVVLTGKHSHVNGFLGNNNSRFNGAQQTFPKLFQRAGYETAIVGKWHLVSDPTGFDTWKILVGQGTYYNPVLIENGHKVRHEGYVTDVITDMALDFLKTGRDPHKPFVLMYHHKAPHREWEPALRHLTLFDEVDIPEPATLFDDYSGRGTAAHVQQMEVVRDLNKLDLKLVTPNDLNAEQLAKWTAAYEPKNRAFREAHLAGKELAHWKYERYIKDYLRCVTGVDENVGRLLDYLDQSGLAKNTVVVYSSDQGFYLGEHGWFDKRFMYEESYRMPLLVRWPGVTKPGSVCESLVSNLDFAETFLDGRPACAKRHAGAEPGPAAGRQDSGRLAQESLLPLLRVPGRPHGE
jgi:arylsulfatase A-like enzyme